ARLWVLEGFAGGIQPWWHHVGAYQEDRRMFRTIEPLNRWHKANETYLINREPIANVGVVWSQQNTDFYGRDNPDELVDLPYRGFVTALIRARIPWLPVHADHIERDAPKFSVLVLPNVAAMSDAHCQSVRRFVQRGGGIVATGEASLCNESGEVRADFGLADVFGVHLPAGQRRDNWSAKVAEAAGTNHTYLRLTPELGAKLDGPKTGKEPTITGTRHPVLAGFDETDLLPYGGTFRALSVDPGCETLATFVPPLPYMPPESVWMREPLTNLPGLITRTSHEGARIVFIAADIDRRFARDNLPDHGNLLANAVRWAAKGDFPLQVEGKGFVDCHLYRQANRLILHIVNLTNAGTWRAAVDELIPIGPVRVRVKLPENARAENARSLVSDHKIPFANHQGHAEFELKSILDHEVAVIGLKLQ
ncbi:MAG TPA: Tat pathway signal protein, partial [Verrucomicrobiae bacterium]|nr:Tat pathway signal protein [Verrucomicrobiae bacterium]